MGLFFPMEGERHEDDRRRTGFARYRQVLERDWKELLLIDFAVLAALIPYLLGVSFAIMNESILALLPASLLGGAIASLGIGAMYDFLLRRMRDDRIWCMAAFVKSLRQNWRAGILPGMLEGLFIGFLAFSGIMMYKAGQITFFSIAIFALAALIFTMVFRIWWAQVVLFEQRHAIQLKNCLLFILRHPKKLLLSALVEVLWWGAATALLPYSAFLVPFLGVWYILLAGVLIVYDDINASFRVEEQINQRLRGVTEPKEGKHGDQG